MDEVQRLGEELARLRAQLRAAVAIGAIAAVGLAVAVLRPPPAPDVLAAREVVLLDEQGATRGQWRVTGLGAAELSLSDQAGHPRLALSADDEQATAVFMDDVGRQLVRLSSVDSASSFHMAHGAEAATLRVSDGGAVLTLADLDRAQVVGVSSGVDGATVALSNTPQGGPDRRAILTAGAVRPEQGPALILTTAGEAGDPQIILQGAVNAHAVADGQGPLWEQR